MPDREKVIKGLEHCLEGVVGCQKRCPYKRDFACRSELARDALALLKKQEAVSTIVMQMNDGCYIFCGSCNVMLAKNKPKGYKYCPWCGKKVNWNI